MSACRQAADQAITASMLDYARAHGSHACIALASGDQGFAKILLYCRSLGCRTVAVCWCVSSRLPAASSHAHMGSMIWLSRDGCKSSGRCVHSGLIRLVLQCTLRMECAC